MIEDRFIVIGTSAEGRLLIVAHTDRGDRIRIISARTLKPKERRLYESSNPPFEDDLRDEYDETVLRSGVRGKYVQRLATGSNIVRLAPDVAAAFPTEEAVNEALRLLLNVAKTSVRQTA